MAKSPNLKWYIIFFIIVLIYYFHGLGNVNILDDIDLLQRYKKLNSIDFYSIFLHRGHVGLYFRPLITLSYQIDKVLFNFFVPIMYFENILFFFIAAIFFYKILDLIFEDKRIVMFSTLWFIVNPLSVESVAWISGRTDLLALMFLNVGFYFLFKFTNDKKWFHFVLSMLFMTFASLSKETAIMFVLAVPLIMTSREILSKFNNKKLIVLLSAITPLIFSGIFFVLRNSAFVSNSKRISLTLVYISNNPELAFMKFFRLFGFYIKKIIIPWPLNFAITGVDPGYDILGFLIVIFAIFLLFKNKIANRLFLIGLLFLLPVYPISLGQIAWTSYAERYDFIASSYILPFIVFYLFYYLKRFNIEKISCYLLSSLLIVFFITSAHRAYVWGSNVRLYENTVKQEPDFQYIWYLAGLAYFKQKEYKKAEWFLENSKKVYSPYYSYKIDYILGKVYLRQKRYDRALECFNNIIKHKKGGTEKALNAILRTYLESMKHSKDLKAIKKNFDVFFEHNKDKLNKPDIFYNLGKLFMNKKYFTEARVMFKKAYELYPKKTKYKMFALKLYKRLENRESFCTPTKCEERYIF